MPNATPSTSLDDRTAARLAGAGDAEATASLLHDVRGPVVAIARRILGANDADVEDAVQQTLIAFVQALRSYRGEGDPGAFARVIAVRTAIALRRRARAHSAPISREREADELPCGRPSLDDEALAERRRAVLRSLLAEIPAERAEALALRVVLGWSLTEIAVASGVPVNTVRSRIRLAKEALRRKIESSPEAREAFDVVR